MFALAVEEMSVFGARGEIAAAAQHQRLVEAIAKTEVALLDIVVFVGPPGLSVLSRQVTVTHQCLIAVGELLPQALLVHCGRQGVCPMQARCATQGPEGILQTFAEALEALAEADADVPSVREGQREVIEHVVEWHAGDRDAKLAHVAEIRLAKSAGDVFLREVDLLRRPIRCTSDAQSAL